jgi:cytosine/adenosine deaminase-related metal-dependent hydrolase
VTEAPAAEVIVTGRWVVCDPRLGVASDNALVISGGKIVATGARDVLCKAHPKATLVGGEDVVVLPGFVNSHHHSFGIGSVLRGVPDQTLETWIVEMGAAPALPPDLAARLAGAALLRSGVTTLVDMCGAAGPLDLFSAKVRASIQGYRSVGLRTIVAPGIRLQNILAQADGEDALFLATLPRQTREIADEILSRVRPCVLDYIDCIRGLIAETRSDPQIDVWFGPPGPQWVGIDGFVEIATAAENLETRLQTHALESFAERQEGPRSLGRSRISALAEAGTLSSRLSIAHAVWASDSDLDLLAQHGVSVSHSASSNLRLRAGIAPLAAFLSRGLTVGIGLDGTSLADDDDMFAEMRLAANLQRVETLGGSGCDLRTTFDFATRGGAQLVGYPGELGELTVGANADLSLVLLDRILWPWTDPDADPLDLILSRATARDVRDVMVNGTWRLKDGVHCDLNFEEAGREAAEYLTANLPATARREAARALALAVHVWHKDWAHTDLTPHSTYNSRT